MTPARVPRLDHWPVALRSAALGAGTLLRCGTGVRPAAWPETPEVRCAALGKVFSERFVACDETAAWIWGACRAPGDPLDFAMRDRTNTMHTQTRRPLLESSSERVRYHQYRFEEYDVEAFGAYEVTSRVRTAFDLLRSADPFTRERRIGCRLLLFQAAEDRSSLVSSIERRASRSSRLDRGAIERAMRRYRNRRGRHLARQESTR